MPLLKQLTFSVDKESCLYQVYTCIVVALNAIGFRRKARFDVNLFANRFIIINISIIIVESLIVSKEMQTEKRELLKI